MHPPLHFCFHVQRTTPGVGAVVNAGSSCPTLGVGAVGNAGSSCPTIGVGTESQRMDDYSDRNYVLHTASYWNAHCRADLRHHLRKMYQRPPLLVFKTYHLDKFSLLDSFHGFISETSIWTAFAISSLVKLSFLSEPSISPPTSVTVTDVKTEFLKPCHRNN